MTYKWPSDVRYSLDQTYYPAKRQDSEIQPALKVFLFIPGEGDLWEE